MSVSDGRSGRYFEDFQLGDVYRHPLGRTITEADNTWFTLLTCNTNQMHFNAEFAGGSAYGKILVNSGFTVALLLGLTVSDISQNAVANLGWDSIKLLHPVYVGDTLYAESQVLGLRGSKSRPYAGIVKVRSQALNQHGDVCIRFVRSVLVNRRDSPYDKQVFPIAKIPIEKDE
jgi:itaconyl-CoA hydratase